jgi:hypothetical protein
MINVGSHCRTVEIEMPVRILKRMDHGNIHDMHAAERVFEPGKLQYHVFTQCGEASY